MTPINNYSQIVNQQFSAQVTQPAGPNNALPRGLEVFRIIASNPLGQPLPGTQLIPTPEQRSAAAGIISYINDGLSSEDFRAEVARIGNIPNAAAQFAAALQFATANNHLAIEPPTQPQPQLVTPQPTQPSQPQTDQQRWITRLIQFLGTAGPSGNAQFANELTSFRGLIAVNPNMTLSDLIGTDDWRSLVQAEPLAPAVGGSLTALLRILANRDFTHYRLPDGSELGHANLTLGDLRLLIPALNEGGIASASPQGQPQVLSGQALAGAAGVPPGNQQVLGPQQQQVVHQAAQQVAQAPSFTVFQSGSPIVGPYQPQPNPYVVQQPYQMQMAFMMQRYYQSLYEAILSIRFPHLRQDGQTGPFSIDDQRLA